MFSEQFVSVSFYDGDAIGGIVWITVIHCAYIDQTAEGIDRLVLRTVSHNEVIDQPVGFSIDHIQLICSLAGNVNLLGQRVDNQGGYLAGNLNDSCLGIRLPIVSSYGALRLVEIEP